MSATTLIAPDSETRPPVPGPIVPDSSRAFVQPKTGEHLHGEEIEVTDEDERILDQVWERSRKRHNP